MHVPMSDGPALIAAAIMLQAGYGEGIWEHTGEEVEVAIDGGMEERGAPPPFVFPRVHDDVDVYVTSIY